MTDIESDLEDGESDEDYSDSSDYVSPCVVCVCVCVCTVCVVCECVLFVCLYCLCV